VVRGTFLKVDEGDRLRRAVAGSGATGIQVAVTVYDLVF
jgi:NADH dehydrogenase FAD-containing subunit